MGMTLPFDYHGERFLPFWLFKSRASALKMRRLDEQELEFYEKHCLLLPVARTHKPPAHAVAVSQRNEGLPVDKPEDLDAPEEWRRLQGHVSDGMHCFDREQGRNPLLVTPDCTTFEPWDAHRVSITLEPGSPVKIPTVDRYYAYWQVHVVELLRQQKYYERARPLPPVSASNPAQAHYALPKETEWARTLRGMATGYDMLTLFEVAYSSVVGEASAHYEGEEMPEEVRSQMWENLGTQVRRVMGHRSIDEATFFSFVVDLERLTRDYRDMERTALAEDVEGDIWLAQRFAHYAFHYDWKEFLTAVERQGGAYASTAVRRLDPIEAAADDARTNLGRVLEVGLGIAVTPEDAEALPDQVVAFCIEHELFEVLSGLAGFIVTWDDLRRDRFPGFRHRRLRPLALAVEQFTRGILSAMPEAPHGTPLRELFRSLGADAPWVAEFKRLMGSGLTSDKTGELDRQVRELAESASDDDPENVVIARTFVVAVAARNLVSHRHLFLDDETVGELTYACACSVALVWILARRRGLV